MNSIKQILNGLLFGFGFGFGMTAASIVLGYLL